MERLNVIARVFTMDIPTIPGYEILAPLSHGGMSAVFKARQISLDRVVVLKILPPTMATDEGDLAKFLAEAKITAQLKHPNIVQVYDFGKSPDGIYYFVMEFVSGYSVADWIRRKTKLSVKDTLLCAHCVAEALSYAWTTFGIVHCDIKPDNVMIDGDGTVKVTDLGVARSVLSVMDKAKFQTGVVVGTPYYISPEQSKGQLELDCRADIYSLGAMLYHCITGKLPFEGLPPLEIMDCQITDQIPDIVNLQPHVSTAVACLIEKMMAKNPDHRQKDWTEVIRDMTRARLELLPEGPLPPEGASTMSRCAARAQYLNTIDESLQAQSEQTDEESAASLHYIVVGSRQWLRSAWRMTLLMILIITASSLIVTHVFKQSPQSASPQGRRLTVDHGRQPAHTNLQTAWNDEGPAKAEDSAQSRLKAALQWSQSNPGQFDEAIRQFEKIAAEFEGTRHAQAANYEVVRLKEQKRGAVAADMKAVYANVQPLLDRQKWREAAQQFEQYQGPFKTETEAERAAKIKEWLDLDTAQRKEMLQTAEARNQEQIRQWSSLLEDIAALLVAGNAPAALDVVHQATNNTMLAANQADLLALANMLTEADCADKRLLDSFRSQKGREIVIALTNGPERLVVRDVQDDTILVEQKIAVNAGQLSRSKVIRQQDLSLDEKKARLGTNLTALAQGLMALRDGDLATAETAWSRTGPFLSAPLTAKLQERKLHQREDQARHDFVLLLHAAQMEVSEPLPGCEVCLATIYGKTYPPQTARALAKSAAEYRKQYGETTFAQTYAPVLAVLQQAPPVASNSNQAISVESAPIQIVAGPVNEAAVRKELFARNPGLVDFNVTFVTNGDGKIVRVELISLDLKDIKPLTGLPDLRAVVCSVTRPNEWRESSLKAPLSDLSPLKGLPLQELSIIDARVKDIAPLAGMPLTKLNLTGTRVTDLSVLKGMPLQELTLSHLTIKDLKPLAGMPLEYLNISQTEISDLTPLTGMKLKRLIAPATRIRDITVLAGMPLTELNISRTEVSDIAPLAGMKIGSLNLSQTRVRDLASLAGMPLRGLDLSQTNVRDLSPISGLALDMLNVRATRVKDIDPLQNMPLKWLDIGYTDVRDLAPLRGVPLKGLNLSKTAVRDLTPIQNSPIEELNLDYNANQQPPADTYRAFTTVLLRMPRLQKVNGNNSFREGRRRK